jgi:hypothetical protein
MIRSKEALKDELEGWEEEEAEEIGDELDLVDFVELPGEAKDWRVVGSYDSWLVARMAVMKLTVSEYIKKLWRMIGKA